MEIFLHPLFTGMTPEETAQMQALHAFRERTFPKGAYILRSGDRTQALGLVRAGGVHIESCDVWGERSILSYIAPGQVFAETYAVCGEAMMVDAVAAEDSEIVFLDLSVLLGAAQRAASWYPKLMQNLLRITARKNLTLSSRIFCTTAKSVRGRLLTYLSAQAAQQGRDRNFYRAHFATGTAQRRGARVIRHFGQAYHVRRDDCTDRTGVNLAVGMTANARVHRAVVHAGTTTDAVQRLT